MPEISRALSFDVGIERVITGDVPQQAQLPAFGQILPGETSYQPKLTDVLYPKSLEQQMLDELRPNLSNRDLLAPTTYSEMVDVSRDELKSAAKEGNVKKEDLDKALAVLAEDQALRELLSTYRHLLHRA